VTYSEDNQKVLLSLRQAEILEALAADKELKKEGGCVPDLQDVETKKK
jgi:glutamate--cysteine ligase catalytic subunit